MIISYIYLVFLNVNEVTIF